MENTNKQSKIKKKVILNPEGDEVIIDPEKTQDVKEATAVLSVQQRRQRAIAMRRRMPMIKRARELAVKRIAGKSKIKRRSRNLARKFLKRRVAGSIGASYQSLSPAQKVTVDRMVATKSGASRAIASRLVPRVRTAELQRVSSGKRASTYNMRPITASKEHPDLPLIKAVKHCIEINEDLRNWFNPKHPEGGWKRINSKGEVVGPCAREPGEPKPKCMSNEKIAKLSKQERAAAVAAKRRHDPVADRPGKGGKPVNVSNFGKGKISEEVELLDEKNKPTNPELWSRAKSLARSKFDVYPSAYANGWAAKWYKSKGGGWKSTNEQHEMDESFLDGKNPQDKGDMARYGLKGKSIAQLKKIRSSDSASPREKQLAHWYINMHTEGYVKKSAAQKLLDAIKRVEARKKPLPPTTPEKK